MGVSRKRRRLPIFGAIGILATAAFAATAPAATQNSAVVQVPTGTHVRFHLTAPLSSNESKTGQHFDFVLIEPIVVDGTTVVAAGEEGEGTVLLAGPAGMKGHEGDLTLRLDFIEDPNGGDVVFNDQHFEINGTNAKAASALAGFIPIVGFFAQFIRGQDEHVGINHEIETVLTRPATILGAPEVPPLPTCSDTTASTAEPSATPSPTPAASPMPSSEPACVPVPIALVTPYGYAYPAASPAVSPSPAVSTSPSPSPAATLSPAPSASP